ncbi:MAG: DUF2934 domain-containing protein [Variovorax sp.]|nr:MAG: DUF2934 domain-containing protein [Variovorax sp.]
MPGNKTPEKSETSNENAPATGAPVAPLEAQVRTLDLETAADITVKDADPDLREARIRQAAYAAYLRRGGQPGDPIEDWLEAERSLDAGGTRDDSDPRPAE